MSFFSDNFLSYAPVINEQRKVTATRISALRADGDAADVLSAYQAFAGQWPASSGTVLLDLNGAVPTEALCEIEPCEHVWLEIPAALATAAAGREQIADLHIQGFALALLGRPAEPLPPELLAAFRMSLISVDEDRRSSDDPDQLAYQGKRKIGSALVGVKSIDRMEQGFASGAAAIVGWPFDDAVERAESASNNPSFTTVAKLIQMIGADASAADLDKEIRRDPALAFRLLRFLNSAAFGLTVEIESFEHAVMMIGQQRLKKWLALLISTSAKDANLQPVMFASLRRGLFLERLAADDPDPKARDDAFILGVFSLLDKLFREPFAKLFESLPISESVHDALVDGTGQYMPYLKLARSLETPISQDTDNALTESLIPLRDCNAALVDALVKSSAMAGD